MGRKRGTKRKALEPPPLCFFSGANRSGAGERQTRNQSRRLEEALNESANAETGRVSIPDQASTSTANPSATAAATSSAPAAPAKASSAAATPPAEIAAAAVQNEGRTQGTGPQPGNVNNNSNARRDSINNGGLQVNENAANQAANQANEQPAEGLNYVVGQQRGEPQNTVNLFHNNSGVFRPPPNAEYSNDCPSNNASSNIVNTNNSNMYDKNHDTDMSMNNGAISNLNKNVTGEYIPPRSVDSPNIIMGMTSSQSQLSSVSNPLGQDIPPVIKDKIIKGEYVDFSALIDRGGVVHDVTEGRALSLNSAGQVIMKEVKSAQKINSVHTWTSAFLVFSAIYLRSHPGRTQEILKYGHTIRTAASRFGGLGWREYDIQFRMRMQVHPDRSWATMDSELWAFYVVVPASPAAFSVTNQSNTRGGMGHSSGPPTSSMGGGGSTQKCFDFNKPSGCNRQQCKFGHKCMFCNRSNHGASNCRAGSRRSRGGTRSFRK